MKINPQVSVRIWLLILLCVFCLPAIAQNFSLQFDGADDYVEVPDASTLDINGALTLEAWVRIDGPLSDDAVIISKWLSGSDQSYYMAVKPDLTFAFGLSDNGSTVSEVLSYYPFYYGRWYHVAAVYEPSVAMRLYVNGQLLAEETSVVPSGLFAGSAPLTMGNYAGFPSFSHFGAIDEARVWSTDLAEADVNSRMFAPLVGNESDLRAYFDFDAGAGTTVADKTINSNNGVLRNGDESIPADGISNGPLWENSEAFAPIMYEVVAASQVDFELNWMPIPNATGLRLDVSTDPAFSSTFITNYQLNSPNAGSETIPAALLANTYYYARLRFEDDAYTSPDSRTVEFMVTPGNALDFESDNNQHIGVGPGLSNTLAGKESITVEAWVKLESIGASQAVVGNFNTGFESGMQFLLRIENGYPAFWVAAGLSNNYTSATSSTAIKTGEWVHVAGSWDGADIRVFLNGVETASSAFPGVFPALGNEVWIANAGSGEYMDGQIDELRIWSAVRTLPELQEGQYRTLAGNEPGLEAYYRFDDDGSLILTDLSGKLMEGALNGMSGDEWQPSAAMQPILYQPSPSSESGYVVNWRPTQFGDVYFEVDDDPNFPGAVQYPLGDGAASSSTLTSFLTPNTKYYGRIFATDGQLQTPYSQTLEFMVGAGNALNFDGADDKVDIPGLGLPANNFTIEAWVNTDDNLLYQGIFSASSSVTNASLVFGLNGAGNPFINLNDGQNDPGSYTDSRTVASLQWTHLAVTFDGTNFTFYINGAAGTPGVVSPAVVSSSMTDARIGVDLATGLWKGAIDEIKVWSFVKTDFSDRFNGAQGNESGLSAYFRFDEETGTVLPDLSGNALSGDWTGPSGSNTTATWIASGAMQSTTVPAAPSNLVAYTLPGDEIRLEWQDNSTDETSFYTQVSTSYSTGFSDYVAVGPNANQATVGLNPDEGLFFRVRAINNAGTDYSPVDFATTVAFPAYALQLNGTDDFVSVPHNTFLNIADGNFTLEAWVYPTASASTILSKGSGNEVELPNENVFTWQLDGSNNAGLMLSDGTTVEWGLSTTAIPLNQWSHVAVTYNSSSKTASFFLNGQTDGTHVFSITPSGNSDANPLFIGKQGSSCNCNYFEGQLDEVRIWNDEYFSLPYVFTPLQGNESNLVAYYALDENTGDITVDRSPNTNDGQLMNGTANTPAADGTINGPIWSNSQAAVPEAPTNLHARVISDTEVELTWEHVQTFEDRLSVQRSINLTDWTQIATLPPGASTHIDNTVTIGDYYFYRVVAFADVSESNPSFVTLADVRGPGNSLEFDGSAQYAFAADNPLLDLTTSFTIESWVYLNTIPPTDLEGIVSKWNVDGNERSYGLAVSTAGELVVVLSEDGSSTFTVSSNQTLEVNQWYHVAATYEGGSNVRLYIDGQLDHEETAGIPVALFTGSANLVVGNLGTSGSPSSLLNARIDELRIWNTARLEPTIQDAMFSKLIGPQSGLALYYGFDEHESAEVKDLAGSNDASFTNMSGTEFTSSNAFTPVLFTATEADLIGFRANWLPVADATGYTVYLSTNAIFESPDVFSLTGTSGTEFISTSLSKGQTYYYRIDYETDFGAYSSNWSEYQTFSIPSHNALFFDGVDDVVELPHNSRPSPAYSIEAFINTSSANPLQTILAWGGPADFFILRLDNGYLSYTEYYSLGDPQSTVTFSGFPLNDGTWHHVAMVRSGNGPDNVTLYIDGDPVETGTGNADSFTTSSLHIGAWDDEGFMSGFFSGGIDELRVWEYALTEIEIESSLTGPKTGGEPSLRFYYDFNVGISGDDNSLFTILPDISPSNYPGDLQNFALTGTESNYLTSDAFAYKGPVFYVDANALGGDGSSWAQAFTDLQLALFLAGPGDEIWVAAGNYLPSDSDQTLSFDIPSGVSLYGGFNGTETAVSERDFENNVTVLDGNVPSTFGSFNIVNVSGTGNNAILDGFTITGADNQANSDTQDFGGGIKITGGAQPTLANLIISDNECQFGGGLYISNSEVTINGGLFYDNNAQSNGIGGAIYADAAVLNISDTRFNLNTAWEAGAVYLSNGSTLTAVNVDFDANSAFGLSGGGIESIDSDVSISNGRFFDNYAGTGGAIAISAVSTNSTLNLYQATVASNTTGGAISLRSSGGFFAISAVYNSILWSNSSTQFNVIVDGSQLSVNNSVVQDWNIADYSSFSGTITGSNVITSDPLFSDLLNGDLTLGGTSPAIDFGDVISLPLDVLDLDKDANTAEPLPFDLEGNARVDGTNPDAGAYEYQTPVADISVVFNEVVIPSGSVASADYGTHLGSNDLFYGKNRVFTIHNPGTGTLTLSSVTISGDPDFSISVQPASSTISPETSETFQLSFMPSAQGLKSATVTISSDDPDQGTYTFNVAGEGILKTPGSHYALEFAGTEFVSLPSNSYSEGDWITLEAWIKTSNIDVATILTKGDGSNYRWALELSRNTIGSAALSVRSGSTEFVESATNVADGNWHHLAGVFDNVNNTLTLYVDGIEEGYGSFTVEPANQTDDIYIGADPGLSSPFIGQIDEVRVWRGLRPEYDIRQFMTSKFNEVVSETEFLATYLRFDEGAGSVAKNLAGFADATVNGAAWVTSGAPLGDFSNFVYGGSSVVTADLSPGGTIEANGGAGTVDGIHLYRIDNQPNILDRPIGYGGFESTRYFGVFLVKPVGFQYEFQYNYGSNDNITDETALELATRSGNNASDWLDLPSAILDEPGDNIWIFGQTANAEYIVGFTNTVPSDIALDNTIVPENTTLVGNLSATDPDNAEVHLFSLVAGTGDTDNASFAVSGNVLQFIVAPDFETKPSYDIRLEADDQHGGVFEKVFVITVTDMNEASAITINELALLAQAETFVFGSTVLQATDPDLADDPANLTYTITSATVNGSMEFVTDPGIPLVDFTQENIDNGDVVYIHDGSATSVDSFNFDLADGGENGVMPVSGTFNFSIDLNNTPTDIDISGFSIPENTTVVGALSVADADVGDVHVFTLVPGAGDTDNASLSITGTALAFINPPDFEVKDTYDIRIRVDDQQGGIYEETFTIGVTDVNETPFVSTNLGASLSQGGAFVIDNVHLLTQDPDVSDTPVALTYTVTTPTANGVIGFTADPGTGITSFTQEDINEGFVVYTHDNTATAADSFSFSVADGLEDGVVAVTGTFNFTITLAGNSVPTDIALSSTTIAENGTNVGTLSATDPDVGDTHLFTIVAGTGDTDNGSFTITGNTLQFLTAPDFETKASYELRIAADDQQGGIYEETFTIGVTDLNETPFVSTNLGASLSQGGAFVIDNVHLLTQDPDVSDIPEALTYTVTTSTANGIIGFTADPAVAISSFTQQDINDALVVYTHDNTATAADSFSFLVADGLEDGVVAVTGTFNFTITLAGNSNPTDIGLSSTTIAENLTNVGTLSATDPDVGDTHLFSLVAGAGDTDNTAFSIAGNTLSFITAPNFEVKNSYQVRILATDQASGTYSEAFVITVTDVNEPPVIANQTFETNENNAAFQAQLVFSDPDANTTYAFQFLGGNTGGTFAISAGGLITVADVAGLDFETNPQFNLTTEVSDLTNTATATITINLSDVLEAPQALAADQVTTSGFRARWQSVAGAEGYRLEVATDELFANRLTGFAPLELTGTESVVSGLYHSSKYFYRVAAYQGAQTTAYSDVISVLTQKSAELTADSTALVKIFDQMGGAAWANSASWKSAQVRGWFGIVVQANRVTAINLAENNLAGAFPALSGSELNGLKQLDLFGNQVTSMASTNLGALEVLDLASNQLDFASLEPFAAVASFTYAPQADRFEQVQIVQERGVAITFDRSIGGSANTYQWLKNDVPVEGATASTFEISFPTFSEEGNYTVNISNTTLSGLTIKTRPIVFKVSSLERDKLVLSAIYNTAGGENWINETNWNSDDVSTWFGVTVADNRVTQLRLPNNGLTGDIPSELADLRRLEVIDLSGNSLTSIPNLTNVIALTQLKLENNKLQFDDLEPNINITGITFSPQKLAGEAATHLKEVNSSFSLELPIGGSANQYQWYRNGTVADGLIQSTLNIGTLNFETMGNYELEISNSIVAGLTLRTEIQRVLATANIAGLINDKNDQIVNSATGVLLGIRSGAYDSTAVYTSGTDGSFHIPNVVLGNYLLSSAQDLAVYIPTYYQSTVEWDSADVIELRDHLTGLTLSMQNIPVPLTPDDGDNSLFGILEADLPEPGRVLARGRVKGAGVSMGRQRFRGKGTEDVFYELVAYVQTDENGEFQIDFLPDGTYRLNIQYPGVPVDPNSFIIFELGGGAGVEENAVAVNALVTPTGIVVSKVEETGIYLDYFKNLEVFPNPADKFVTIRYEKLIKGRVEAELLTTDGRSLLRSELKKGAMEEVMLDVTGLNNGLYILRFHDLDNSGVNITNFRLLIEK